MVNTILLILNIKKKSKNIELLLINVILAYYIRKIMILYIILHIMAILKIPLILYTKKLDTSKVLDCLIIKIYYTIFAKKEKYEKLDIGVFIFLNYIFIYVTPVSIKSIDIASTIINIWIEENYRESDKKYVKTLVKFIKIEFKIETEIKKTTMFGIAIEII